MTGPRSSLPSLARTARHLRLHAEMAPEFTEVSGEPCLNTRNAGGAQLVQVAVDPTATSEDVVEFVRADSLSGLGGEL